MSVGENPAKVYPVGFQTNYSRVCLFDGVNVITKVLFVVEIRNNILK